MKVKMDFEFGELVKHKMNEDTEYMIVSLQLNWNGQVTYGVIDSTTEWKWFKPFEMVSVNKENTGFPLELD